MNAEDLKALRLPLLVLVCTALIAAGAIYYTNLLRQQSEQKLLQQQKQLKEARTRLQRSGEEKDVIVRYLPAYRQLQRAGFVGEEQRINWLDGLRIANQRTELFGVDYQIGVQHPYLYASELGSGSLPLMESVMKLRFRLLHGGDLLRFFDALDRQNVGEFVVNQCNLTRIDTGGVIRYQPNIAVECELSWITIKPNAATEKKP
jgi:hypothetical protein